MPEIIRATAEALVRRHGTRDPFLLALYEDVRVLRPVLPERIHGFYQLRNGQRTIRVNALLPPPAARAVCAHELGHALLHPAENSQFLSGNRLALPGRLENDAELFAFYLLTEPPFLQGYDTLERMASVTGLSEKAITLGLRDCGVMA